MLDSVYQIHTENDMLALEKRIGLLCHGEHGRCKLLRSAAYQRFRIQVLYNKDEREVKQVYFDDHHIKMVCNGDSLSLYCGVLNDDNADYSEYEGDCGKRSTCDP
jgi:hypothetical protein